MPDELRALTIDDVEASWELTRIAFGAPREPPPGWHDERPGRTSFGILRDGRLVAKATDGRAGVQRLAGALGTAVRRLARSGARAL